MKFKKLFKDSPNQTIFFEDKEKQLFFNYLSYNHSVGETALRYNGRFYILLGDLRKELEKCKDIEEAKQVFIKSDLPISGLSDLQKDDLI